MTPEDIRSIIREELAAVRQELREEIAAAEKRVAANKDRAVQALSIEINIMRQEFSTRLNAVERALERNGEALRLAEVSLVDVNRWADQLDKSQVSLGQSHFDQRRAIEELRRRM
jgi:hypothetical protein